MDFQNLELSPIISGSPFNTMNPQKKYSGPRPAVLLILDGWGIGPNYAGNAIARANTPNMDRLWASFPHTQLSASGQAVGLPHGEDGNTETGHLNIGAGSIVYQDLPRINMAIADGTFNANTAFLNSFEHIKKNKTSLHIMGLVGAGGVHSNIEHLYALLNLCKFKGITNVYIHAFTDGRDSPPTGGASYVKTLVEFCEKIGVGRVASIMGRFYAMDRDKRWDRVEKAYNCLTLGDGIKIADPVQAIQDQYAQGTTDEFMEPTNITLEDGSVPLIKDGDAVLFFNYRIDRPRELTKAFVKRDF